MPHPDPDDLALAALGEQLNTATHAHIDSCADCTAQVDSFRSTIDLAGLADYGRDAPRPGEHVWDAITDELGFAAAVTHPTAAPAAPIRPADRPRRRWRWVAPIAAALVGVTVGAGAVILVQNQQNAVTVDATAALSPVQGGPLPASDGQLGTAELVTARTGQEQVRVDAPRLPPTTSTSYEVWLFGNDGRMVSLGTLAAGTGSFTVPDDIDTLDYRTVDISDEPPAGNPAHSGISLIRGTFT